MAQASTAVPGCVSPAVPGQPRDTSTAGPSRCGGLKWNKIPEGSWSGAPGPGQVLPLGFLNPDKPTQDYPREDGGV